MRHAQTWSVARQQDISTVFISQDTERLLDVLPSVQKAICKRECAEYVKLHAREISIEIFSCKNKSEGGAT